MHSGEPEATHGEGERLGLGRDLSEHGFRRLIDDLQVGILIQGTRSEVLFANRAALGLLGLIEEQILGKTSLDATSFAVREDGSPFPGEDHPAPRALATGRPVRNVVVGFYRPVVKDQVWLLISADPQLDAEGRVVQVISTLSDLTAFKRAEDRLRESEARYRQLVEKAQDIIFRTDAQGTFTYVNPVASRLMGQPESALLGRHFSELIRQDHRERVAALLVDQFRRRLATTYDEFVAVAGDGRELWFGQHVQLLMEGDQVLGFQAVARDITERKRAEEVAENERRQLREIVTHAPVAMAILDREGRYLAHSKRWLKLWGIEGQTLIGRAHQAVFAGFRLPEKYARGVSRALAGEVVSDPEDAFELADGSQLYLSWTLHPWRGPDGGVEGVMAVVRNIDALVRARQAALQASRLKSEFLANMSHELRTPLNAIIGMATLMIEDERVEAQRTRARLIDSSGQQLLGMIDEILDFSKAEAGQLELEVRDFMVRDLIRDVAGAHSEPAAAKGLELACTIAAEVPDHLRGDPRRLRQVLAHLVGNAVKFTDAGRVAILATLLPGPMEAPTIRFEISDSGIGIHPDARSQLFLPFRQADGSTTRRHGGTGLGLAISKRLVEAMGGEITVSSEPGRGTTFTFTARFGRPATALPPAIRRPGSGVEQAAAGAGPAPCVLVVDDNALNRKVVVAMLERLGYRHQEAGDGIEAVEACSRNAFDAVLMDCHMPQMDGFAATAWIRQREGTSRRTPIIALTASTAPGDRQRCLAAGMDDYLGKPARLRVLGATLAKWTLGVTAPASEAAGARSPLGLPTDHPLHTLEAPGQGATVVEIIDLFLRTAPLHLDALRQAHLEGNLAAVASRAHSLKGAALQLGVPAIADVCERIQGAARAGDAAAASALLQELAAEVEAFSRSLAEDRRRLAGPQG